ncbi:MAG: mechanosensitive ion channel family protein [Calditrichia bacterium]
MNFNSFLQQAIEWLISSGLRIILIVILMLIALRLAKVVSRRVFGVLQKKKEDEEFRKRTDTLSAVLRYVLSIVIMLVALIMILGVFGVQIGPILAAAGVVGVAVGFGAQSLVKDVIGGFFILLEDQIRVGDVVQVAGKGGQVEKITLRMTTLRDLAGNVQYIPNGEISVVTNMTKDYSRYVFDIGVAYRENVDEVIELIKQIDEELRNDPEFKDDIIEPLEVLGLDQFADSAVIIKARTTTKPIKQWRIGREFNRRMKVLFDEKNIEIPFPHVTLYMGEDKNGDAPPMHLKVNKTEANAS